MQDIKAITVVIATFNAERSIGNCLDSIVFQITDDCELIIVDGASSDRTMDIVRSYGAAVACAISEADDGVYDAWNKGIKFSKGRWIMFVGADDILMPDAIENYLKILANIDEHSVDYVCGLNNYMDLQGKPLRTLGMAPEWSKMRRMMVAAHVASLHSRKNLFEKVGLYDARYKICGDYELLLRKRDQLRFHYSPTVIAKMSVGGMSFSTKALLESYQIRGIHRTISPFSNFLMLVIGLIAFYFFVIRKTLMGAKL